MLEYFDRPIDDPMSIEFMLDRLKGMLDRFEGIHDRSNLCSIAEGTLRERLGGMLDRLGVAIFI